MPSSSLPAQAQQPASIDIETLEWTDGTFSWGFTWMGVTCGDSDFTSREAAIADAKSFFRNLTNIQTCSGAGRVQAFRLGSATIGYGATAEAATANLLVKEGK